MLAQLPSILLLIFGFGFVIFFHELGHFLAAKWVGIKVEQFAVGFGQALFAWRKGIGWRVGSTQTEYEKLVRARVGEMEGDVKYAAEAEPDADKMALAAQQLNLGETEYRLNWVPLGGYVKMLGQDDLKPNARSDDPRAYNRKSIAARMLVVSAGVLMNILLAAFGFMTLFLIGFRVEPAVVGSISPLSPAQYTVRQDGTPAPLQVGDRILYYDGTYQHDFTKITLNVALSGEGATPMYVRRVNGAEEHLMITPQRPAGDPSAFLMIGIAQPPELRGIDPKDAAELKDESRPDMVPADTLLIQPGDVITAVNGQPVRAGDINNGKDDEYYKLDRALQASE